MRISTKIWLSISAFAFGYLATVVANSLIALDGESRIIASAAVIFPDAMASQKAEAAFKAQRQAYLDAVLSGDKGGFAEARSRGGEVADALATIAVLPDLDAERRLVVGALAAEHRAFSERADRTYPLLAGTTVEAQAGVEAAALNAIADQFARRLASQAGAMADRLRTELAEAAMRSSQARNLGLVVFAVVALLTTALVAWVVTRWTRRLVGLVQASDRLAAGDVDHRIDDAGNDEIGHLARSFAAMRAAVQARSDELRRFNENLEGLVHERTLALSAANQGMQREVEERSKAEHALRLLESAVNQTADAVLITTRSALAPAAVVFANPAFTALTGITADEAKGRGPDLLAGVDDVAPPLVAPLARAAQGHSVNARGSCRRADGVVIHLEIQAGPVRDRGGAIVNLVAVLRDVSEQRVQDEALRASEDRFRNIVNTAMEGIWLIDQDAMTTFVNRRMAEILGYGIAEMTGRELWSFMDAEARGDAERNFERRRQGVSENHEFRFRRKDGSEVWTLLATSPVYGDHGQFIGALALATDITQRRQDEQRLRRLHAETERILSSLSAILVGIDRAGRVVRWNDTAAQIFGLPAMAALGRPLGLALPGVDGAVVAEAVVAARSGRTARHLPAVMQRMPGSGDRCLALVVTPYLGEGGDDLDVLLLGFDVTTQKALEGHVQHGRRLETIGSLAGGVARDLAAPLRTIDEELGIVGDACTGLNRLLAAMTATNAAASERDYLAGRTATAIGAARSAVTSALAIVGALRQFTAGDGGDRQPIDLAKALSAAATLSRGGWQDVADLVTDFASGLAPVTCQPGEINQVFLDLIVNAGQAIAERGPGASGTITLSTRCDGDWAEARIADTGIGIAETAQERIFSPFFTTRQGGGQGLFLAHAIVTHRHGGEIRFESVPGQGATFIVRLPLGPRTVRPPSGLVARR